MKLLRNIMDFFSINVLKVMFTVIFLMSFFVKAMYSFDDSPYFANNNIYDFFSIICVLILMVFGYINRKIIQKKINYKACFVLFILAQIFYIYMVPLKPFSDMRAVYDGAINFSTFQWDKLLQDEYWSVFPVNIKLAVFWGILLIPLPKTLFTVKIINAIFIYIIIAMTRSIAKRLGIKYYNVVYAYMLTFSSLFFYSNHIYFDIPTIMLIMVAIYIYMNKSNTILSMLILGIARYTRSNVTIFLIAIILIELFKKSDSKLGQTNNKKYKELIIGVCLFSIISQTLSFIVDNKFVHGNFKSYSGWNQIYIGLNEAEFGFMDNDFSYDRDFDDVIDRVKGYGPERMAKIICKKTFWLWSQGTYQAQRYAFGADTGNWAEKFEYETPIVGTLLNDNQILRKCLNAFMRAQYLLIFALMILHLFVNVDKEKYRLFYYILIATFLIMLIYELKSRFILQILPIMFILAGDFFGWLEEKQENSNNITEVKM